MYEIIILTLLSFFDILRDREVPDLLVYIIFLLGIYWAWDSNLLPLFFGTFLITFILVKLGVFGTAEAFIFPVLITFGIKRFFLALFFSLIWANLYILVKNWKKFQKKWLLLGIFLYFINPILPLVFLLLFLLFNTKAFNTLKEVPKEKALDEYSPEYGHITKEKLKDLPEKIKVKEAIPFFPFLLLGYLSIEFLNFLTSGNLI